ncbi:hypothetical protein Tsubulata_031960 [Turnera subulata]|uniref:RRM domain-containing protein n=1 Tax=Turnera subulata TaxID=218843 RepID=A0A9Q0GGT2_9ROSI|nr:hypothetical protein Tsubulata_031960 [Turnera subulata]
MNRFLSQPPPSQPMSPGLPGVSTRHWQHHNLSPNTYQFPSNSTPPSSFPNHHVRPTTVIPPFVNHQQKTQNPPANINKPHSFSKWSRREIQNAIHNHEDFSVYVENLPARWAPTDIRLLLSKFGDVMDVFIPGKMAASGKRFAFVRFKCNTDNQTLFSNINMVEVDDGNLLANLAKGRRPPNIHP